MSQDCVFCKIVQGEIPSARVLETDRAIAFLDINPVNLGHLLLLPRSHHESLLDLPEDDAAHVGALLPRLCRAVVAATGAEAFNLIVNNGRLAGQTVFHGHWHIIPRFPGDAVHWPWPHRVYDAGEMPRMQERIRQALAGSDGIPSA
jgi:histidine triad (HIT) family protein